MIFARLHHGALKLNPDCPDGHAGVLALDGDVHGVEKLGPKH